MYYVVGAEFRTTEFLVPFEGTQEEHGPFRTYEEAYNKWASRAWATVDNCLYRFIIEERVQ